MGALDEVFESLVDSVLGVLVDGTVEISEASSSYDPLNDSDTDQSATAFTTKASPPIPLTLKEIDGSSIRWGDVKFVLANSGAVEPNMKLTHNAVVYRIMHVTELWSGDRIAAYEVVARR